MEECTQSVVFAFALTQINDKSLGQTTHYICDLAGNRVREQLLQKTLLPGTDAQTDVLYQDNHVVYKALMTHP